MIQNNTRKTRAVALLTGGVLASTMVFQTAPAKADPSKEQLYKGGATALGVLGAYFILKGKTIPGAIAGAGAYYAYKKGKDVDGERYRDDDYYRNDGRNNDYRNDNDRYDRRSNRRSDSRNDNYYRGDDYNRNNDYYDNDYRRDNRTANTSYPEYYDYSRVAPAQNNHSGAVVLK